MIPISFGPQVCGALTEGAAREWLVPDGLGGYAMGTVSGLRTRRYHGLLMVSGATAAATRARAATAAIGVRCSSFSGGTEGRSRTDR